MPASPAPIAPAECPTMIQEWVRQLLDPRFIDLVRDAGDGKVDVTLCAHKRHASRQPTITISLASE